MTASFVELRMKMVETISRAGWEPCVEHWHKVDEAGCEWQAELTDAYTYECVMGYEPEQYDA